MGRCVAPNGMATIVSQGAGCHALPKIFTPDIAARASFSLDETGEVFFTGACLGGYGTSRVARDLACVSSWVAQ